MKDEKIEDYSRKEVRERERERDRERDREREVVLIEMMLTGRLGLPRSISTDFLYSKRGEGGRREKGL